MHSTVKTHQPATCVTNEPEHPTWDESDTASHIHDTPLFIVWRNGRALKRSWNEMTGTEKQQQLQAQKRAAYVTLNNIYA